MQKEELQSMFEKQVSSEERRAELMDCAGMSTFRALTSAAVQGKEDEAARVFSEKAVDRDEFRAEVQDAVTILITELNMSSEPFTMPTPTYYDTFEKLCIMMAMCHDKYHK